MQTTKDTTISNIIWKYANYRRGYRDYQDVTLELLTFVYDQKVEAKDENISRALRHYQYVPGILSQEEEESLLNSFPEVIETFCHANENGMTTYTEALQPYEITTFAAGLLNLKDGAKVYNPFAGYASYAIAAPQYKFTGDEINEITWAVLELRLMAKGIQADYSHQDSYLRMEFIKPGYFEGAIATPPFNMRGHSEIETAEKLINKLGPNGRLVMLSSLGSLFRGGKEERIRQRLIDGGLVESIIEMPDNLFFGTSKPCAVIVLSNRNNESIKMVDASNAFKAQEGRRGRKVFDEELLKGQIAEVARDVPKEEIVANGYRLLPKQYLLKLDDNIEYRLLKDLCDIQGAVRVNEEIKKQLGGFVSLKGLSTSFPTSSLRKEPAKFKNDLERGYVIADSRIIVLRTLPSAESLSIGYVDDKTGLPFLCGGDFHFVLTVKSPIITPQYLMLQLQSEYVWKQVKSFATGPGMARISPGEFMKLRIPIVSLPEQEILVRKAVENTLSDVERKRAKESEQYREGVHLRKHALEQTVSSLSSRWNKFASFAKRTGEFKLTDIIPGVNNLTVAEQIEAIDNLIKLAAQQVENLAEVKVKVKSIDTFNPTQLIMDYLRRYQSNLYLPVMEFTDMESKDDTITFPISILEQIFNNIIANAVEYGFHNTETPGNKIRFRCFREDSNVIIEIANNGEPLKEGVEAETIFTANFSTLLNTRGHSGTGATEVRSLMEQFGGSAEAYSTPDEEYTLTYKLIFNESND
jgi:type I restriction enzyme M protein